LALNVLSRCTRRRLTRSKWLAEVKFAVRSFTTCVICAAKLPESRKSD